MQIPKLAKGGIVSDNLLFDDNWFLAREKGKDLFFDKYYEIYKRTKNRRIKKKQEKKSWRLKLQNSTMAAMIASHIQPGTIQICMGGRIIGETFIEEEIWKTQNINLQMKEKNKLISKE